MYIIYLLIPNFSPHSNVTSFFDQNTFRTSLFFHDFSQRNRLKNLSSRIFFTENKTIYPIKIRKNTVFPSILTNNDGKCEIFQALHDEFCRNTTQRCMLIPKHTDHQLGKKHNQDGSIDCLLGPTACWTHMDLIFHAMKHLLKHIFLR